jgi:hypothetical protein
VTARLPGCTVVPGFDDPISGFIFIMFLNSADLERGHRQLGEPTDAGACYRDAAAIAITQGKHFPAVVVVYERGRNPPMGCNI